LKLVVRDLGAPVGAGVYNVYTLLRVYCRGTASN